MRGDESEGRADWVFESFAATVPKARYQLRRMSWHGVEKRVHTDDILSVLAVTPNFVEVVVGECSDIIQGDG
jgi:hypothetical protein